MKIGELLARTQKETLEEIAKQYLTIGKMAARQALKNAGCYCKRGVKGWHHDNLAEVAERSIYEFAPQRKQKNKTVSENEPAIKKLINTIDLQIASAPAEKRAVEKKLGEFDSIDRILFREELEKDLKTYAGFYWDADIIEFLENVRPESKSELMNEIVRSVLVKKGFL